MSEGGTRGRIKLGELTDAALADAEQAAHAGFVADLAVVTRTDEAVAAVAERFLTEGDRGRLVFLEWLARLRVRLPKTVLNQVSPLLADTLLPVELRVRASARALRSARSSKTDVDRIVASLTVGLSPLDALSRLRAVQSRMRRSRVLDAFVARRERRLRLACPHCRVRLGLAAMARHLHASHGLILDRGRARRREKFAKELRKQYAAARDTTTLDEAAVLSSPAALRGWAARTRPTPEDLQPLLLDAAGRGQGLCPRCLAELPHSVEPLPPPLTLAHGQLSGDGYVVAVRGPDGFRTCSITTPAGVLRSGLDGRRAVGPRATGVAAAGAVIAGAVGLQLSFGMASVLTAAAYAAARLLRGPLPAANQRAVDRAWSDLAPRLERADGRDRFLTRLCRTSLGLGDVDARAGVPIDAIRWSAEAPPRAAVRFLQTDDAARHGVDRVGAVGELLGVGINGDEGVEFAECVAELFQARTASPADVARLRILALDAAYSAGFTPRALADLWAACPRLRELMDGVPLSRLGVQHGVWSWGGPKPWASIAGTGTAFELARVAPTVAGRLLCEYPDLLLYHRPPPGMDESPGWVLVCARGVVVGGQLVADPDAEVRVEGGRVVGSATLVFGPHRLTLPRRPRAEFVTTLRRLLRVRAEHLLPRIDAALAPAPSHPSLAPLARRCVCGADVFVSPGRVGRVARFAEG